MTRNERAVQAGCNAGNTWLLDAGVRGVGLCRFPHCGCVTIPAVVSAAVREWEQARAFQPREFGRALEGD